jgi:TPP-dependent 2-oxoacid decarboxylase
MQSYQPYAPTHYYVSRPTNGLAVTSLVMGVLGWSLLPIIGAVIAVGAGHAARRAILRTGDGGNGLALAGLILGWLQVGPLLLLLVAIGWAIFKSLLHAVINPA